MHETIDYNKEKRNSERITRNDEELIKICDFEVGHKDGNCKGYKKAQKLRVDEREVLLGMFCVIIVKLIAKMKELMRRHDVKTFKVDSN